MLRQEGQRVEAGAVLGVGVDHHRRARLARRDRDGLEELRDVADQPMVLDGALEESGADARVVDLLGQLADEQLRDRVGLAVGEEF